ncbi:M56 family metallopeptidase [Saccharopolyspora cebuensis]|uniref:M56 family metallopeptidase n=1 Tax=Saccharopolyspora cebuensis TaxID=418759 RepID=A0ABV4CAK5_9PSEU
MLAGALLLGVALVACGAPAVLAGMIRHRVEPQTALACWLAAVSTTALTAAAALVVIVLPGHGPTPLLVEALHHCWAVVRHGATPKLHVVTTLVLLAGLAVPLTRVGSELLRFSRRRARTHRRHLALLRITAAPDDAGVATLRLPHAAPMAYSVAGSPGFVVVTDGLERTLRRNEVAAVLEHERAHLRGAHHALIGLADAVARAAPWIPLLRRSPELVRTLVELAADRVAARAHGTAAVRDALLALSGHADRRAPRHALAMAEDAVDTRLHHLDTARFPAGRVRRGLTASAAGLVTTALPAVAGTGALAGFLLAVCPALVG